jgi:hypothetical protein
LTSLVAAVVIAGLAASPMAALPPTAVQAAAVQDIPGLVDEYTYVSPLLDYTVEWSDPWIVEPVAVALEEEGGEDYFGLTLGSDQPHFLAFIGFDAEHAQKGDPIERWSDPGFYVESEVEDFDIEIALSKEASDASTGAIILLLTREDQPATLVHYKEFIRLDDGATLHITLNTKLGNFAEWYDEARATYPLMVNRPCVTSRRTRSPMHWPKRQ